MVKNILIDHRRNQSINLSRFCFFKIYINDISNIIENKNSANNSIKYVKHCQY